MKIAGLKKGWRYDFSDQYSLVILAERNRGPVYELVPVEGCPDDEVGTFRHGISVKEKQFRDSGRKGYLIGEALKEFKKDYGFEAA